MDLLSNYLSTANELIVKSDDKTISKRNADNDSSCNTSECSFEMEPENEFKGIRLCSIDELFASPPKVQEFDKNDDKKYQYFVNDSDDDLDIPKFPELPVVPVCNKEIEESPKESSEALKDPLLCWSCQKEKPKYKCPQCNRKSCSLPCVKYHKEKLNCQGERIKTEYVGKQDFNEAHLLSDYRFLEEIGRCVSKRNHFPPPYFKSKTMYLLSGKARNLNIRLKILPSSFKKRKKNSTFYCFKTKQFLWHVEWVFDSCDVVRFDRRLPDSTTLQEGVDKFITATTRNQYFEPRLNAYRDQELNFYMKKEECPANNIQYYKLDGSKSLRLNLEGKTLVEYPILHVVLASNADKFQNICEMTSSNEKQVNA